MSMNFATDVIVNTNNSLLTKILKIPTSSGGTTYGVGTNGQMLKSNGTSVYWGDGANITSNTSSYWNTNSSYVPAVGEIIVYNDAEIIKIGDGTTTVANLSNINSIEVVRL